MPALLIGVLMVFATLAALGIYALVEIPGLIRRALPDRRKDPLLEDAAHPVPKPGVPKPGVPKPSSASRSGAPSGERRPPAQDLYRYPRELSGLEDQLVTSLGAVRSQRAHLDERFRALSQKEGRAELAARYAEDLELLDRREAGMQRVLGLVWKARALLTLRAYLAESSLGRPELPELPSVDDPRTKLDEAARLYVQASQKVRNFLVRVQERAAYLNGELPVAPMDALVLPEARAEVEQELKRVAHTFESWIESLDRLADTLAYLADRCRTRTVVQGSSPAIAAASGGETLMNEVEQALGRLKDLADAGDRSLADLAVRNLAEDISQLERAGLEAEAEAEAAIEVARLLEQF